MSKFVTEIKINIDNNALECNCGIKSIKMHLEIANIKNTANYPY